MKPEEIVKQVTKIANQLETIRERLEDARIPREALEEFKRVIDHTRITLWAMLSLTEADLAEGVAHFRLQRAEEMCQQVQQDIEKHRITARNPDLAKFYDTMRSTMARVEGLLHAS